MTASSPAAAADSVGGHSSRFRFRPWLLAGLGLAAAGVTGVAGPAVTAASVAQNWSAFVLVAGLLLVGVVADGDGVFAFAGHLLARTLHSGAALFAGAVVAIGVVTALLNLDTSVAFLTPVLVYAARSRGAGEADARLLYGSVLLANAGSLFLPGSNLTNLIVLGHLHLTGGQFLSRMWLPALVALTSTGLVVALLEWRGLRHRPEGPSPVPKPVVGVGVAAIIAAALLVLLLPTAAPWVLGVGVLAAGIRLRQYPDRLPRVLSVLGLPTLLALFGFAVALGSIGRAWAGPATLLSHLDPWSTAAVGAVSTVAVNNLPAAALLAARPAAHPFALLIGLNLGPNLFATGSLAWLLWLRSARSAGAHPSIWVGARIGLVAAPISLIAAVAALSLIGPA